MSWHGGDDDEVDNDSVGWFNARDYAGETQQEGMHSGLLGDDSVDNDSVGWFSPRDYI